MTDTIHQRSENPRRTTPHWVVHWRSYSRMLWRWALRRMPCLPTAITHRLPHRRVAQPQPPLGRSIRAPEILTDFC